MEEGLQMAKVSVCDICGKPVESNDGIKLPNDRYAYCICRPSQTLAYDDTIIADLCSECTAAIQETINRLSGSATVSKPESEIPEEMAELHNRLTARRLCGDMNMY